jgi:protein required for attachment to host cells
LLNAGAARILRDVDRDGHAHGGDERLAHPVLPLRALMADRPGRSFSSGSRGQRSAMVYGSDPERDSERAFARTVAARLEEIAQDGGIGRLVILADPEMLGLLRDVLPESIGARVVHEEALNLLNLPEPDLPAALVRAMADKAPGFAR